MNNTLEQAANPDNYLNSTMIFGEMKRFIFSKNFKGGSIVNIFGRTEIDFSRADINGPVIIDISQTFGETIIKVPTDWFIIANHAAIFAEVADKRIDALMVNNNEKVLVLKGFSVFGAVAIINCA